jgi:prepilin-type N-terminal cleavage/methylation domain-containing protein
VRGQSQSAHGQAGFTLLELLLVIALMVILAGFVLPSFWGSLRAEALPTSARDLRSLIYVTRANAMLDGLRYRIRFPEPGEMEDPAREHQPLVEVEALPIEEPGQFPEVRASWARDAVLEANVRCVKLLPGMPKMLEDRFDGASQLGGEEDAQRDLWEVSLVIEPDGTAEWATFLLVRLDDPTVDDEEAIEAAPKLNVMVDGRTGQVWVQRPLSDEEMELLKRENGSHILHMDRIDAAPITEENILHLRDLI